MKAIDKNAALILLTAVLLAGSSSCVMEDRTVEFVITQESCATLDVDSPTASFGEMAVIFLADELNDALGDDDAAREDVVTVRVVSLSYGVTEFSHTHDWTITGSFTVERQDVSDGPETLLNYTDQSVLEALGVRIPADLNADGVGVINRALDDFIAGGNPVLIFRMVNSGVSPAPTVSDNIEFQWEPCLVTHIVVGKDIEVPDPF
jgi:hypothetical protein